MRGNVGDVALAEERQQVVLAQAVEIDVLHDHHLAVFDGEQRVVEDFVDVHAVAAREELERLFDALRGIQEPFAARIFSELGKELPYERLHYSEFYARNGRRLEKRNSRGVVIGERAQSGVPNAVRVLEIPVGPFDGLRRVRD